MTPFPSLNEGGGQGSTLDTLILIHIACILIIQLLTQIGKEPISPTLSLGYHFSLHHQAKSSNIITYIFLLREREVLVPCILGWKSVECRALTPCPFDLSPEMD